MKTVTIEVTQEDIDQGVPSHAHKCAVARAMSRSVDGAYSLCSFWGIHNPAGRGPCVHTAKHDEAVTKFIQDFDNGKPVKPFTFTIEVPE